MGRDLSDTNYFERVTPPPGRALIRYRLSYLPFVRALSSGEWPVGPVGLGLDIFPVQIARARATIPQARVIPAWLPWGLPGFWLTLLFSAVSISILTRRRTVASSMAAEKENGR